MWDVSEDPVHSIPGYSGFAGRQRRLPEQAAPSCVVVPSQKRIRNCTVSLHCKRLLCLLSALAEQILSRLKTAWDMFCEGDVIGYCVPRPQCFSLVEDRTLRTEQWLRLWLFGNCEDPTFEKVMYYIKLRLSTSWSWKGVAPFSLLAVMLSSAYLKIACSVFFFTYCCLAFRFVYQYGIGRYWRLDTAVFLELSSVLGTQPFICLSIYLQTANGGRRRPEIIIGKNHFYLSLFCPTCPAIPGKYKRIE